MTKSNCHGIRRVIRLGYVLKLQNAFYHVHDLRFPGFSIAYDGLFYLRRCILKHLYIGLTASQENDAARLGNGNAGRDIRIEKQFLNGDGIRMKRGDQFQHVQINAVEPGGQPSMRRGGDDTAFYQLLFALICIQDPEAHDGNTGIDPKDPQSDHILFL